MSRTAPLASRYSVLPRFLSKTARPVAFAALIACCASAALAAVPNRLRADAALTDRAELPQQVSHRVTAAVSLGHVSGDTAMPTMSLVLAPTAAQSAALDQLLAAQQNPASPSYHQWLTPAQFGAQFGVSDGDLQVMQNWLTSQGFQVLGVAPSRNQIQFAGTASLVESAFSTTMTRLRRPDQEFFENSSTLKIPAAFQGVVAGVTGLSSYRMQKHDLRSRMRPEVTTNSTNGTYHSLSPWDVRQIYDANALVSSGFNGNGVSIGIIGQSAVDTTQLSDFQRLTGQTLKSPTLVLVPGTGTSTAYQGDEGESEADLEFAGGVAPGASLYFIYSGSSTTADVITALEYAITNNTAQILSLSYGGCEVSYGAASVTIEQFLRQAGAQGQTIVVASGDTGAAGCDTSSTAAQDGLQVSYPASSPSVTAVGGTTLNDGSSSAYWSSSNNSQLGSALGYIPETAWNDTYLTNPVTSLSASGGGKSALFSKPNWQTGSNVPADNTRDIPDISFSASNNHDSYIWCTADSSVSQTVTSGTFTGACTTSAFGSFQVGGTSLSTPSFAGMLAVTESANGGGALGNINPLLYSLSASNSGSFHDITSGDNIVPCVSGTLNCSSSLQLGYSTGPGYDLATGLGSMDIGVFATKLTTVKAAAVRTPTVVLTNVSSTATSTIFTATVSATNSSSQPTGTVNFSIDGGTATPQTLTGASSTVTVNTGTLAAGAHTLTAAYGGDGNYAAASSSLTFTTGTTTGNFSVAANPGTLTVTAGQTGTVALNFTSNSGFAGLLTFTIGIVSGPTQQAGCFIGRNDLGLAAGSTASVSLVYHSLTRDCTTVGNAIVLTPAARVTAANHPAEFKASRTNGAPIYALLIGGGLLGSFAMRRRKPWMTGLLAIACTAAIAGLSGCGNGAAALPASTTTTTTTAQPGTYNLQITATSVSNSSLTATTNLTLVVQ